MVKDSDYPSKYFCQIFEESVSVKISPHQNFALYGTRQSASIIKVGVVYINVHVSRHLKEEPAWAIDKRLRFIINIMSVIP